MEVGGGGEGEGGRAHVCLLPVCASWNDPRAPPGRGVVHGCRDLNGAVNILKIFKQYVLDGSRPKYLQRPRKGTQGGWWIVGSAWAGPGEGGGDRTAASGGTAARIGSVVANE